MLLLPPSGELGSKSFMLYFSKGNRNNWNTCFVVFEDTVRYFH